MEHLPQFVMNHMLLVMAFFAVVGMLIATLLSSSGGITPQGAVQLLNREGAVAIDVRAKPEYDKGHIIDSVHVPLGDIKKAGDRLKKYKSKPLIVYCASGNTSQRAMKDLKLMGFERVYSLKGGIAAWREDKLPVKAA